MKTYFTYIKFTQELFLLVSILILATLPSALALTPEWFSDSSYTWMYGVSHAALFFVMLIRPLADIFSGINWLRPLVILRKGVGVFSAAIIVSFIIAKLITDASGFLLDFTTNTYWSTTNLALFAHLADISAILLLVTSNNFSKRLLGSNWKRLQRLSYVYFYSSALYVIVILQEMHVLWYVVIVTIFTVLAWLRNHGYILQTPSLKTT
jgi:DMSO/TMAO reductase YedYZ heme-binding membrane subunit